MTLSLNAISYYCNNKAPLSFWCCWVLWIIFGRFYQSWFSILWACVIMQNSQFMEIYFAAKVHVLPSISIRGCPCKPSYKFFTKILKHKALTYFVEVLVLMDLDLMELQFNRRCRCRFEVWAADLPQSWYWYWGRRRRRLIWQMAVWLIIGNCTPTITLPKPIQNSQCKRAKSTGLHTPNAILAKISLI